MNVLVINCGSSSLKFQLRAVPPQAPRSTEGRLLAAGLVQGIGGTAELTWRPAAGAAEHDRAEVPDYRAAVRYSLDWLRGSGLIGGDGDGRGGAGIDAVGHRFVHGGSRFTAPALVDAAVRDALDDLRALAPLHNGPALAGLEAVAEALGSRVPHVAVFDTAFHATLPEVAHTYGLPHELSARHGIRRYGFHGTSCRSVLEQYADLPGARPDGRAIVLHLGSGCSATAVRGGRSVETSMGFTPLEGLLMGTRSGDLDPALPGLLARRDGLTPEQVEALLNERSGLRGVSGRSNDLRELLAAEAEDPRARLAVELFCYRVRKYVGAYLAVLEGLDALLFTGGVGEHLPAIRERICGPLAWCGVRLDAARNEAASGAAPEPIGADGTPVQVCVIPSDEERVIAWDAARCLAARPG